MDAKELYEIVKDVPRAAWPECVTAFIRGLYVEVRANPDDGRPHAIHAQMFPDDAELLFVGSMVRWLAENNGGHWAACAVMPNGEYAAHPHMGKHIPPGQHNAATLVAALASACKAVGGGE